MLDTSVLVIDVSVAGVRLLALLNRRQPFAVTVYAHAARSLASTTPYRAFPVHL
jgi:hypothetical protein